MDFLKGKCFRLRETIKKIQYIREHTTISLQTIEKAANVARCPGYHTFGHEVGAAEQAVRIAIEENLSLEMRNMVAIAMFYHDAGHKGLVRYFEEEYAYRVTKRILSAEDTRVTGLNHCAALDKIKTLILATTFAKRGESTDIIDRIVQDADLAHLGLGIPYWLYSSMGLVDEFRKTRPDLIPEIFIRVDQEEFINHLLKVTGTDSIYLSEGANKIFRNSKEDVVILKNLPVEVIDYAYKVRKEDLTLEEFTRGLEEIQKSVK